MLYYLCHCFFISWNTFIKTNFISFLFTLRYRDRKNRLNASFFLQFSEFKLILFHPPKVTEINFLRISSQVWIKVDMLHFIAIIIFTKLKFLLHRTAEGYLGWHQSSFPLSSGLFQGNNVLKSLCGWCWECLDLITISRPFQWTKPSVYLLIPNF